MDLIQKDIIEHPLFKVNALSFIPENNLDCVAIFSHGYTSHKASILNWAQRLCEAKIPTIIFDLPGHYLGSYHEVANFTDFTEHAHELFEHAYKLICKKNNLTPSKLIIGGHSLGALLSIRASELTDLKKLNPLVLTVGFGLNPEHKTHLFDTPLYQKTLEYRNQLVSPAINKDEIFAWIKEAKINLNVKDQKIHMISGLDDQVVGKDGLLALVELLSEHNVVTHDFITKLPHHMPEMAAPHIYSYLKKYLNL